jgi:chloramphenicol 3-O-phosphotransferase
MADLPSVRLKAHLPPFFHVGVDYFGPLTVKRLRKTEKRYGCLFTCLVTRAVHIKIAYTLDTDSYIMALRRMISRRGKPQRILSDNGTNFVGANRELRECLQNWNKGKINEEMVQQEVEWHFNPPAAPHFGGVWERLVQSCKRAIRAVVGKQTLTDEVLLTVMAEVEALLNSRPLTHVSTHLSDEEALTPNHFLLGRPSPNLPPDVFVSKEISSRRRWRQAQVVTNHVWKRWLKEYVPNLLQRRKWTTQARNLQKGDLVLVVDPDSPRGVWPLGRVIRPITGDSGIVRAVEVKTKRGTLVRPVAKIALLEEATQSLEKSVSTP